MTFTPKTWENPGTALTDLETRAKTEFDAHVASLASETAARVALQAQVDAIPAGKASRSVRVSAPAMSASSTIDVDVAWPSPFADTAYTANVNVQETVSTAANGAVVRQIRAVAADKITVRISNGTQAFTAGQVTIHATAVHD